MVERIELAIAQLWRPCPEFGICVTLFCLFFLHQAMSTCTPRHSKSFKIHSWQFSSGHSLLDYSLNFEFLSTNFNNQVKISTPTQNLLRRVKLPFCFVDNHFSCLYSYIWTYSMYIGWTVERFQVKIKLMTIWALGSTLIESCRLDHVITRWSAHFPSFSFSSFLYFFVFSFYSFFIHMTLPRYQR